MANKITQYFGRYPDSACRVDRTKDFKEVIMMNTNKFASLALISAIISLLFSVFALLLKLNVITINHEQTEVVVDAGNN